jgi:putative FmdB family regulatory protein
MAVYEYLCPKCRIEFELMRPISEAEKPAKCPKCGSKAQKLISVFGSKTGDSIQPAGEPFRKRTVVRAPSSKVKATKTNKRRTKR